MGERETVPLFLLNNAMSQATSPSDPQHTDEFFRCPVQSEQSKAFIVVGRKRAKTSLQETSIDGFTVLIPSKEAGKLKVGKPWILEHDGTRIEVMAQWFFNAPDGNVQVGLRRMRDLTPIPTIKQSWGTFFAGKFEISATSSAGFGGFVLVLFCAMALPGLGEQLGTSDRIQGAVKWVFFEAKSIFGV